MDWEHRLGLSLAEGFAGISEQPWHEGAVNRAYEHMRVYYRSEDMKDLIKKVKPGGPISDLCTHVALIAPGERSKFVVQFLVNAS